MIGVLRGGGPPLRIGHRGAAALAPENSLRSFDLAIAWGVDLVEFDLVARGDGTLVIAHSVDPAGFDSSPPTLDEALAHFEGHPGVGLHLDLKTDGREPAIVDALRRHGAAGRTLITAYDPLTLRRLGSLEPDLRLGLSYPLDRWGLARRRLLAPAALGALAAMRASLPRLLGPRLARAGATVASLQHMVVTRAVVERCHAHGVAVFAWTVDDPRIARRLARAGIDGIITNDPRLFRGDLTT